ncbi:MAG TPA: hypothetical protein VNJ04_01900 [Gemmatimonadaceae bacterium]|nr:hypothetical protein [Gemmatimonadaceae bacterium]
MKKWLSGGRAIFAMILIWTVGWGLGFGGLMELYDPDGRIGDVWPTVFAIPGFIGGIMFCALLRAAEGRRRFDEVSLARFATWGFVTGLVLGLLTIPAKVGDVSPGALGMIGIMTVLSTIAAVASAAVFRFASRRTATVQTHAA